MCRIVGKVSKEYSHTFEHELKAMLHAVAHGGPDDEGIYLDGNVAIGHRRLSIIDLSAAGHQPMLSASNKIVISYNGEIYNYLDIKRQLETEGFIFRTKTDTEVIICAYQKWGTDCFTKFEGIFAFALFDKENDLFFLVRDQLGVKPLYYFINDQELIFSSEVKAFRAMRPKWPENEDWKILFLAFGSIPHPYTTLSDVFQLPAGSYLALDLKKFRYQVVAYYKINTTVTTFNEQEALQLIHTRVLSAIRKNLIADAPLGIFLSGGIDSSLLALIASGLQKNVRTISVNFDEAAYDESRYQKMVLDRLQNSVHTSHLVTEQMFWDNLDDIWKAMDQPSIDGVNSYFVNQCAKSDGIKAVLSGLGADEIFGGYASFSRIRWMRRLRKLPFKKLFAKLLGYRKKSFGRLTYLSLPAPIGDYLFLRGVHTPSAIAAILNLPEEKIWSVLTKVPSDIDTIEDDVEYACLLESKMYMSNQLLKDTDYMGMWHGVEVRVPFLDVKLLEEIRKIASALRYKSEWPKFLLTASFQNTLPKEIIFRKKNGFTFPFALWMKRSKSKFFALFPANKEVDLIYREFEKGKSHWSTCWSLAVINQFR